MVTSDMANRHLTLARAYLSDAVRAEVSPDTRLTAAWNAGLQVALADPTLGGRRPPATDWERDAEARLVEATGGPGRRLTTWAADRYYNPFSASPEAIAEAVAAVEGYASECASR